MNVLGEAQLAAVHTNLHWHLFENNALDTAVLLIMWTAFIGPVGIIK